MDRLLKINFHNIRNTMPREDFYREMRLTPSENIRYMHVYSMMRLNALFNQQLISMEIPCPAFLLFTRNNAVITGKSIFMDATTYFNGQLVFTSTRRLQPPLF